MSDNFQRYSPMLNDPQPETIGETIGETSQTRIHDTMTRVSTVDGQVTENCEARLAAITGTFQAQADAALTSRAGLAPGDLPEFYAWARVHEKGALRDCVQKQIHGADISGYAVLASKWQNTTAPSLDAFRGAGVPVRSYGGKSEVYLKGSWMSPGAAARAGLA